MKETARRVDGGDRDDGKKIKGGWKAAERRMKNDEGRWKETCMKSQ
jgi:hypothetical protein